VTAHFVQLSTSVTRKEWLISMLTKNVLLVTSVRKELTLHIRFLHWNQRRTTNVPLATSVLKELLLKVSVWQGLSKIPSLRVVVKTVHQVIIVEEQAFLFLMDFVKQAIHALHELLLTVLLMELQEISVLSGPSAKQDLPNLSPAQMERRVCQQA